MDVTFQSVQHQCTVYTPCFCYMLKKLTAMFFARRVKYDKLPVLMIK